ncbi:transcriptional regulator [Klebsiella pneumoniae]|nr:transcriptional regulator [Klebsiella pneumoniae]MBL1536969.1 transcriptional regulator [Klebsiella pneumoniae]MBL1605345.1 transcriptional regulator [Klebsiella pneumoniae]MBL1623129.1 transcriptional regulator [Klebsiella pneumoniae]MBL1687758.1 transcriptional regulator [Klebsiella pneumoniae]
MYYVNAIYYFNNTIEVAMLLLGLNSFITNVIGLVIKNALYYWHDNRN